MTLGCKGLAPAQLVPPVFPRTASTSAKPENQYGFWPGYESRKGQSAIYVQELKKGAQPEPPPARLAAEFTRIEDLGTRDIQYRGRTIHTVRLLLCEELK